MANVDMDPPRTPFLGSPGGVWKMAFFRPFLHISHLGGVPPPNKKTIYDVRKPTFYAFYLFGWFTRYGGTSSKHIWVCISYITIILMFYIFLPGTPKRHASVGQIRLAMP